MTVTNFNYFNGIGDNLNVLYFTGWNIATTKTVRSLGPIFIALASIPIELAPVF